MRLQNTSLVECLKISVSLQPSTANMLNTPKNCTAAISSNCFIILTKIELENVRLSVSKILIAFVNTLNANDKYSVCNRKNLPLPIQLQLSKNENSFSHFFAAYLTSTSNFEHFEKKKNDSHRLCSSKIRDCETRG